MATIGADLRHIRLLEQAVLTCWPSLSTAFDGSWVIRVSDGQTGRANSINVLDHADGRDAAGRLKRASDLYHARALAPTLRATPLTPPEVIEAVTSQGWRLAGESLTMTMPLEPAQRGSIEPQRKVSEEWLAAVERCMEITPAKRAAVGRKLALLGPPAGFFLARDSDGQPVAELLAAVYGGTVGIMDVGVDPRHRGEGEGRRLIGEALAWAASQGAELAWLQVDQSNAGAIGLYRRLGFSLAYPYAYYREPSP